ncbi:YqkE family protein [Heyndrickxia sp. MSNUG]|uniref:YqkE family protein n=1 Tax=Heyndrickxia sp. MSNUG TaxID=3136677 RepID=UPI003C30A620
MKKKKQNRQQPIKKEDKPATLGDLLNQDIMEKLKAQQKDLKEQEEQKKQAEIQRKKEEQRLREKNKSFEELLSESEMDWKKFK